MYAAPSYVQTPTCLIKRQALGDLCHWFRASTESLSEKKKKRHVYKSETHQKNRRENYSTIVQTIVARYTRAAFTRKHYKFVSSWEICIIYDEH